MRPVELTQGRVALVDDEDYERVIAAGKWHFRAAHHGREEGYAARYAPRTKDGKRTLIWLHHFVQGSTALTDHRNGDGLDNRKSNLRPATKQQNGWNARVRANSATGVKGVTVQRSGYRVRVGRRNYGLYDSLLEAARAYDTVATKVYGEFARLNFPAVSDAA